MLRLCKRIRRLRKAAAHPLPVPSLDMFADVQLCEPAVSDGGRTAYHGSRRKATLTAIPVRIPEIPGGNRRRSLPELP